MRACSGPPSSASAAPALLAAGSPVPRPRQGRVLPHHAHRSPRTATPTAGPSVPERDSTSPTEPSGSPDRVDRAGSPRRCRADAAPHHGWASAPRPSPFAALSWRHPRHHAGGHRSPHLPGPAHAARAHQPSAESATRSSATYEEGPAPPAARCSATSGSQAAGPCSPASWTGRPASVAPDRPCLHRPPFR